MKMAKMICIATKTAGKAVIPAEYGYVHYCDIGSNGLYLVSGTGAQLATLIASGAVTVLSATADLEEKLSEATANAINAKLAEDPDYTGKTVNKNAKVRSALKRIVDTKMKTEDFDALRTMMIDPED